MGLLAAIPEGVLAVITAGSCSLAVVELLADPDKVILVTGEAAVLECPFDLGEMTGVVDLGLAPWYSAWLDCNTTVSACTLGSFLLASVDWVTPVAVFGSCLSVALSWGVAEACALLLW